MQAVTSTADRLEALRRSRPMPGWCVGAHRMALAQLFGVSIPYMLGWTQHMTNDERSN